VTGGATAIPEVQALLRALAAGGDVAEMGTAFGETAAVLAETARRVVTVERDPERLAVARERLAGLANVELLEGDVYEELRGRGPFDLVFVDGGLRPVDRIAGRRSSPSSSRAESWSRTTCRRAGPSTGTRCASSSSATRASRPPRSSSRPRWL
jgi:SAM-dependent methyltransferase